MHACQATRPDIAHAVSAVSRFNNYPGQTHWGAVKRILRYLKVTINYKLTFETSDDFRIQGYCDADWANDEDDRRSTTGYIFTCLGGAISWNTRKQPTVALSTTEAEYMALAAAAQEALWIRGLAQKLKINSCNEPIQINCDNRGAIDLAATNIEQGPNT